MNRERDSRERTREGDERMDEEKRSRRRRQKTERKGGERINSFEKLRTLHAPSTISSIITIEILQSGS